jgi:hypothetical protein
VTVGKAVATCDGVKVEAAKEPEDAAVGGVPPRGLEVPELIRGIGEADPRTQPERAIATAASPIC